MIAGIQVLLYAIVWTVGAALVSEERPALVHWSAYAWLQALSAYFAAPALAVGSPPGATALVLSLVGFAAAIRGVGTFSGAKSTLDAWIFAPTVCASSVILVASIASPSTMATGSYWEVVAYDLGVGILMLGTARPLTWALRRTCSLWTTVLVLAPGVLVAAFALAAAVARLRLGAQDLQALREEARMPNVIASLITSGIFNFGYLFLLLSRIIQRLRHNASHDYLTDVLNRRSAEGRLEAAWQQHRRTGHGLAVALVDIDHFKQINDTFGHAAGDRALIAVATALRQQVRTYDAVGRWGGEEFLVVMNGTDATSASMLCERLRTAISDTVAAETATILTVSIGVAIATSIDKTGGELVERADRALLRAKNIGRNRVTFAAP
ncbi:MAG TPA: GGDEF domain-containing protein [Burkholderiaceae bacterium]|nr:GGDEF domain-containing protein [Burkholderiaceae bacterium]